MNVTKSLRVIKSNCDITGLYLAEKYKSKPHGLSSLDIAELAMFFASMACDNNLARWSGHRVETLNLNVLSGCEKITQLNRNNQGRVLVLRNWVQHYLGESFDDINLMAKTKVYKNIKSEILSQIENGLESKPVLGNELNGSLFNEDSIVIFISMGYAANNVYWKWFKNQESFGSRVDLELSKGDVCIMSGKAIGSEYGHQFHLKCRVSGTLININ